MNCNENEQEYTIKSDLLTKYGLMKGDKICLRKFLGFFLINGELAIRESEVKGRL